MNNERAMISGRKLLTKVLGIILSLVLIMSEIPAMGTGKVQAATQGTRRDKTGKEVYDSLERMNNKEPEIYKKDLDPYGNGTDVPFTLVSHDRLALFASCYNGSKTFGAYDIKASVTSTNTGKVLNNSAQNITYSLSDEVKQLNYVQTVAFDPTGSGSKDHIAVIGVRATSNTEGKAGLFLYVCDKNNNWSGKLELGSVNWMTSAYAQFNMVQSARNFFSITAGDYDNDHKETLVVYAAYDGEDTNSYGLNEITVNADLTMSKKQSSHTTVLTHDIYKEKVGKTFSIDNYAGNRLSGALASGDVTGDGIDDLAVVTYVNFMSQANYGREQITKMYRPYVAVSYGVDDYSGDISSKINKSAEVWSNNGEWHTCLAPGISIGNVDNSDGKTTGEIVVAGFHNSMVGRENNTVDNPYRFDNGKLYISVYSGSLNLIKDTVTDSNEWTKESSLAGPTQYEAMGDSQSAAPQVGVQCFNINGRTNAAYVFVNGNIYSVKKNNLGNKDITLEYTLDSFKTADKFDEQNNSFNSCIYSLAVGNFDGNADGREQIVYTVGVTQYSNSMSKFYMGMAGGKDYSGTGIAGHYYSTELNTARNGHFPSNKENMWSLLTYEKTYINCALNYAVCAVDNGDDGVVVQYKSKQLLYSDPEVMAVLQAAPYFKDMYEYITDTNSLTYSIEETMNYEQADTSSTSGGIAICAEAKTSVVEASIKAGYQTEWSESFTKGLETSVQYSWSSGWLDQVVIRRVPVIAYEYEIIDNGQPTGLGMTVYFTSAPSYQTVSVNEYNNFVDYYNEQVQASNNYKNASPEKRAKMLLTKLSDNWLGHEGDPAAYINDDDSPSGLQILQSQSQGFGMGSGSTGFAWSETTNAGYGESQANGVSLEAAVMAGFEFGGNGAKFGVEASIEKMEGQETSLSKGNGKGIEATVFNLDDNSINEASYDFIGLDAVAAGYSFNWQVVRWNSNLKNSSGRAVPIFGFKVTGVTAPAPQVDDLKGEIEYVTDQALGTVTPSDIKLTWSDPSTTGNTVKEYNIYKRSDDGNSRELVTTISATAYTDMVDCKKEYAYAYALTGSQADKNEFVFTITSINTDNSEGPESEKVTVELVGGDKSIASVEKTWTVGNTDIYTICYTDGSKSQFTVTNGRDGADGHDGTDGRDGVDGKDGKDGADGRDGTDGRDGADGKDGNAGKDGRDGANGRDGRDGKDGKDGKDGIGVAGISISDNGEMIFTMTDGSTINAGNVFEALLLYLQNRGISEEVLLDTIATPEGAVGADEFELTDAQKKINNAMIDKGIRITQKSSNVTISWGEVPDADLYELYAAYNGEILANAKPVVVKAGSATKKKISKIGGKKLDTKQNINFRIYAYKMVDGEKVEIGSSLQFCVAGSANDTYTNVSKITLNQTSKSLKVGKTFKLEAKLELKDKDKQMIDSSAKQVRFESSNPAVATVDKNGNIKAVGKGKCYVYAYSRNGVLEKIKITVK